MKWAVAMGYSQLQRRTEDYLYSVGVVHNTFPTPPGFASENAHFSALEPSGQAVLDARAAHLSAGEQIRLGRCPQGSPDVDLSGSDRVGPVRL